MAFFFRRTITGASVGKRNVNAPFPVNVEVVEVQQVPVGPTDVSAIAGVQADRADLNGVVGDTVGVEDRFIVQCIEAVRDVEVVGGVVWGVVGVAVPRVAVDVRLVEHLRVFAAEVGDGDAPRVASIGLREDRRDHLNGRDTDALLFPCLPESMERDM